ncbi:MAG TPA: long-chain-fatty-acid--CoA ligase [Solirubrobacteraceae bacterium]|nr:long-chain-fatty-acid--CoA ligase [Solirubrobacteraceae bacterium]
MVSGSLSWPLEHAVRVHGDRTAVVEGARRLTYRELGDRVARLGSALDGLGVPTGAFVGTLAGNTGAHLECWLAVPAFGRVINSLNHRLTADELAFMIDDSRTPVLVADDARLDVARTLRDRCDSLRHVVHAGDGPCPSDCVAYETLLAESAPAVPPDVLGETMAAISYTGGTTGLPKGVMLSHANLVANAKHFLFTDALTAEDRYVHAGPMFHAADSTMVFCVTWAGGTHILLDRFDLPRLVDAVERDGATVLVLVPTMIRMLLDHLDEHPADLGSLRLVHYAAAPMPASLLERAMGVLACDFLHGYGMTEAAPGVTYLSAADHRAGRHLDSVGHAIPGVQLEIRDALGRPLGDGEIGEICVRGPNIMLGYWNRPEATAEVLSDDGWYRTGDAGRLDGGYLYLADRLKDMIISGGENVYTIEVENAIASHPGVREVAVIARPDDRWGERVHAIIVAQPGARLDEAAIVEHCRERIAAFKIPRSVELRAEPLPKSGAGKVLKSKLRAPAAEPRSA